MTAQVNRDAAGLYDLADRQDSADATRGRAVLHAGNRIAKGQPFPSVSTYGNPAVNRDGTIDLYLGPDTPPGQDGNWIQTVPGRGWFPIFRLYGPLEPYFDKTWQLPDIEKAP